MKNAITILTEEEWSRLHTDAEEGCFGSLKTKRGHLPLAAMDVRATLDGLLCQVELSQTFVNAYDEPLEATYIFPLPDAAAVTRFRLEVAGRVVEGELQQRGQARQTYNRAILDGHRAAIAEEERPGVFTLRVGNLPPGESACVRLSLSGPLPHDGGEAMFRFPLVVAPRYIPGVPLPGASVGSDTAPDTDAVPDASRITPPVLLPGYPNPVRLSLAVEISPRLRPHDFRCTLHSVVIERDGDNMRVTLQPGERLNRDFVLRYRLGAEAVQSSLQLVPDADDPHQGTFVLTVVPPEDNRTCPQRPRDVIFVLDRSGSMGGWKMVTARRAVAHLVETLTEKDRFTIYAFDDFLETPPFFADGQLAHATHRNRYRAMEFLFSLAARGGTEMAEPLDQAALQLSQTDQFQSRDRILVLVTDGQVGNEDQILRTLGKHLHGICVFTLGIDQAVNDAFLKRLAVLGGGCCELVESESQLEEAMYKVHRRIGSPTLSDLQVDLSGVTIEPDSVVPPRKLDLFAGSPITILGRYRGAPEATATLRATDAAGWPWSQSLAGERGQHPAAGVIWARARLRDLEDRYVTGTGDHAELERTIVATSLRFKVLCRFTAYVAVDKSEVVNAGGRQHLVTQAVEAPAGWEMREDPTLAEVAPFQCVIGETPYPNARFFSSALRSALKKMYRPKTGGVSRRLVSDLNTFRDAGALDLSAYRQRTAELLCQLELSSPSSDDDRLRALGVLHVKLGELLDDMRSIGLPAEVLQPLEELERELRALLARDATPAAEIETAWRRAVEVLRTFAEGDGQPTGGRKESFWK